ncbi:MAG: hypothetical protein WCZ69_01875 [Candidatus Paceibacterota bacterium]|jgi:hypothetical protein
MEKIDPFTVQLTAEEEGFVSRLTDEISEIWGHFFGDLLARTQRLLEKEHGEAAKDRLLQHLMVMEEAWEDGLLDDPSPHRFVVFVTVNLYRPLGRVCQT